MIVKKRALQTEHIAGYHPQADREDFIFISARSVIIGDTRILYYIKDPHLLPGRVQVSKQVTEALSWWWRRFEAGRGCTPEPLDLPGFGRVRDRQMVIGCHGRRSKRVVDGQAYAASVRSEVRLRLYGQVSDKPSPDWAWVDQQLESAGTYWVVPRTAGYPHPRPVWGVWEDERLFLSIGTPSTLRALVADPRVTVHLDSGTDVVIIEGRAVAVDVAAVDVDRAIATYDLKYDWAYDAEAYGPLTVITPDSVLAWRAAGWAGRDSFQQTGRWDFR